MGEEKPDTLDFVKDFQEYLSQQTQHVNMISGSVSGVKEADELPAGTVAFSSPCQYCSWRLSESLFDLCATVVLSALLLRKFLVQVFLSNQLSYSLHENVIFLLTI